MEDTLKMVKNMLKLQLKLLKFFI